MGYVGYSHPTTMPSNRHVYQLHIAVSPDYQQHGIGTRLLTEMKRIAADDGVRKLSLRVLSTNQAAIAFYKRFGFRVQGVLVEEFWLDGQYVDDILMWCPVRE